jgi:hypothetical protein
MDRFERSSIRFLVYGQTSRHWPGKRFASLVKAFDAKRFTAACSGNKCKRKTTYATGYAGSSLLYFWCDNCGPYGSGAHTGKLTEIRTIGDALRHLKSRGQNTETMRKKIVANLASGKGLKIPASKAALELFFKKR